MKCPHCQHDAGRVSKGQTCCELRLLAKAPEHIVQQYQATLSRVERETLPLLLWIERQRLIKVKTNGEPNETA